jgi:hypothetical protein
VSQLDLKNTLTIFINEVQLLAAQWTAGVVTNGPLFVGAYPQIPLLNLGDRVKIIIRPPMISTEDLIFDPDVIDNIFKLVQYKIDYPHVLEERRDQSDRKSHKYHYFWVKNKLTPSKIKTMSVCNIADLLHHHDGSYEIPQIFKQYSQVDGRPNRYSLIAVNGLSKHVAIIDKYKLRFTDNGTLRDTDDDMSLKNHHVEWVLLRPGQTTKIPNTLWSKLTDTLMGITPDGRTLLPFTALQKYDDRNDKNDRFGFSDGRVMNDPTSAINTVKNTILNTRVIKSNNVPDFIRFEGFDINNIDQYLQKQNIKKFMSDLWRFASAKQVNEIFFAVLEDTASKTLEISDFFKTSFISIEDIKDERKLVTPILTVSNNSQETVARTIITQPTATTSSPTALGTVGSTTPT